MKKIKYFLSLRIFLAFLRMKYWEFKYRNNHLKLDLFTSIHDVKFGLYNFIGSKVSVSKTIIGDFSYITANSNIINATIGKFCSIATGVKIGLGMHPSNFVSTHPSFYSENKKNIFSFSDKEYFIEHDKIVIGNDVWIGTDVIINYGVTIGSGAIIAAGAIVTSNVESYSIVGGVPAKLIKYRFNKEIIDFLLEYKWWDKEINWLKNNYLKFHDINKFYNEYKTF
jgi:acetyltransferase-like isoleucine patch superfamily enzyme